MLRPAGIAALVCLACMGPAAAQEPAQTVDAAAPAKRIACTVNGTAITEDTLERRFQAFVMSRTGGQPLPPEQVGSIREQVAPQILEQLIDEQLFDEEIAREGILVEETAYVDGIRRDVRGYLLRTDMTEAEFAERIQAAQGMQFVEFLAIQAANPEYRKMVQHTRLIVKIYPDDTRVTEEEVLAHYEAQLEQSYTFPAKVRASHILLGTQEAPNAEQVEAIRVQAKQVLAAAQAPEADFAALAKEHSTGPSGPLGGDLGYFGRNGDMVEPFAAAAFELKPGETCTELVETRFGFHIIKVTERRGARVIALDAASETITEELRAGKVDAARSKYAAKLREKAKIEYAKS